MFPRGDFPFSVRIIWLGEDLLAVLADETSAVPGSWIDPLEPNQTNYNQKKREFLP